MNTKPIQEVADWMKTTDLALVSYRKGGEAMELASETAPRVPEGAFPPCRLVPVVAGEVGLFRFQELGEARKAEKDAQVKEGDVLGHIAAGGKKHAVKAPASGKIVSEMIDDGAPVEYGQPLFFIQP